MNAEVQPVTSVECTPSSPVVMSLPRLLRGGGALSAGLRGCRMRQSAAPHERCLRVLVDMDGVLADFEGGFLQKYRTRYPQEPYIELEERRGFWVSEQYEHLKAGLSGKAISIWESKNFFLELDPIDGAVEAVKEMASLPKEELYTERCMCSSVYIVEKIAGRKNCVLELMEDVESTDGETKISHTDVFICTSPIKRYQYCPYEKYAWVEKHFGHEFLEQIILTRDKTVVSADLLIDDRPDIMGAEANPSWEHILFAACHNRHLFATSPLRRLHSWRDDWKGVLESKRSQLSEGCRVTRQTEPKD